MSPEQVEIRKLSKSEAERVRTLKAEIRRDLGVPHPDSSLWNKAEEILRIKFGEVYGEKYSPHTPILREFFQIREKIFFSGFQDNLVKEFQKKYDPKLLYGLRNAFVVIREIVGE